MGDDRSLDSRRIDWLEKYDACPTAIFMDEARTQPAWAISFRRADDTFIDLARPTLREAIDEGMKLTGDP